MLVKSSQASKGNGERVQEKGVVGHYKKPGDPWHPTENMGKERVITGRLKMHSQRDGVGRRLS